jgi:hypothetical protein
VFPVKSDEGDGRLNVQHKLRRLKNEH